MTILALLVWILILGFLAYAIYRWAPIPMGFKYLAYVVLMVIAVVIVLKAFGMLDVLHQPVPKL